MDFLIGGVAGALSALICNPLDVAKIRQQLQGELSAKGKHPVHYRGVFRTIVAIARNDTPVALYSGVLPAMSMQAVVNCVRLGLFDAADRNGWLEGGAWRTAAAAGLAGAAGAAVGSPLSLVKTQLMTSSVGRTIAVGHQHGHGSMVDALKTIRRRDGFKGLWRGGFASAIRNFMGSSSQLVAFIEINKFLSKRAIFPEFTNLIISSALGGILKSVFVTPLDLVSNRIYNQPVDKHMNGLLYKNILDCVAKVLRTEGFLGFYKGLGVSITFQCPLSVTLLVFWDLFKNLNKDLQRQWLTSKS